MSELDDLIFGPPAANYQRKPLSLQGQSMRGFSFRDLAEYANKRQIEPSLSPVLPLSEAVRAALTLAEEHGVEPDVIYIEPQGAALWNALKPLVQQGTITSNEQLMLLVCLKYGKYPATPLDKDQS